MKVLLLALLITLNTAFSPFRDLQEPLDIDISISISNEEEEALLEEEASVNLLPYIQADPVLNDIFTFGLDGVIATGISRGRVPNTSFHPVSISDWDVQAETGGELYTFTAVAESDDGNAVIETNFNVHYDPDTQAKRLGAYTSTTTTTIDVTTPETPPVVSPPVIIVPPPETEQPQNEEEILPEPNEEAAVEVDLLPEIQADPVLNDIFNFGWAGVIASGISRGRIPNTTFTPVSVSDWSKMTNNNGDWYTFTAEAVSADGNSVVEMTFTVQYNPATQEKNLFSYSSKTTTTTVITPEAANEEEFVIGESIL